MTVYSWLSGRSCSISCQLLEFNVEFEEESKTRRDGAEVVEAGAKAMCLIAIKHLDFLRFEVYTRTNVQKCRRDVGTDRPTTHADLSSK